MARIRGDLMCKCQGCGQAYALDIWLVDDEVWDEIRPPWKEDGAGLLCSLCILERLALKGYKRFKLEVSR